MSIAATITPASFPTEGSGTSSQPRESTPQKPEFVERQSKETSELFDEPSAEDADLTGGGGGENDDPVPPKPATKTVPKPAVGVPPTAPTTQPTEPGTPAPTPQSTDPASISTAMATALKEAFPHLSQQPAPPSGAAPAAMTDEEFAKHTNHFSVDDTFLAGLDHPDPKERVKAYNGLVDGIRKNVVTLAYHMLNDMQAQIQQQVAPAVEVVERQKLEKFQTDFHTAYPSLSEPSLKPITDAAIIQLKSSGRKFANTGEAYKAIAELAAQTIKAVKPEFDLGAPATTTNQPSKTTMPKANGSPSGGGGGAGGSAPATKVHTNVSNGVDVFD